MQSDGMMLTESCVYSSHFGRIDYEISKKLQKHVIMEENTYIENILRNWETLDSGITNRVTTVLLELAVNAWWICPEDSQAIHATLSEKLAKTFTTSWVLESIDELSHKNPSLIKSGKANDDPEKEQRRIRRVKDAQYFSATIICDHSEVVSDFCVVLLKFARREIEPILNDDLNMKASDFMISELLTDKQSLPRQNFCQLICDQMALAMPIYRILKTVVKQHTPATENRKNGGLARWKSKQ